MIDPHSDQIKASPKTPGSALAWLGYAIGLVGLLIFGFFLVLLPILGLQSTDTVERATMFAFALILAFPGALVFGLFALFMRRIIKRRSQPAPR